MFKDAVPLVRYHHERYDGRGYPDGLAGEDIPLLARIISIADAFDAMTSDRIYRTKMELSRAIDQLIQGKDTQFDGKIVDVFLKCLDEYDIMQAELADTYAKIPEMAEV
jgi:HD-GYP domain-containing protein (c-di-GMP phosphodiesterase class II)